MQNEEKLKKFSEEFFGKSMEFLSLKYVETKEEEMIFTCHLKRMLKSNGICSRRHDNGGIR